MVTRMRPQHERAIERLRQRFSIDDEVVALIIVGSVARGEAQARSDVDCYLVMTDQAYGRRLATGQTSFAADDVCDYPGGHAGGPVVDRGYLVHAAERAPEPTRFAFLDAIVALSRDPGLESVVRRIPVYAERERTEKMTSFISQLPVHLSYLELGEYSKNPWLLAETSVKLALFGGRLILAYNRILYPGRKQFVRALEGAPEKPQKFLALMTALLERPSIASARDFYDVVMKFAEWPRPAEGYMARFQEDVERRWRGAAAALADS